MSRTYPPCLRGPPVSVKEAAEDLASSQARRSERRRGVHHATSSLGARGVERSCRAYTGPEPATPAVTITTERDVSFPADSSRPVDNSRVVVALIMCSQHCLISAAPVRTFCEER